MSEPISESGKAFQRAEAARKAKEFLEAANKDDYDKINKIADESDPRGKK